MRWDSSEEYSAPLLHTLLLTQILLVPTYIQEWIISVFAHRYIHLAARLLLPPFLYVHLDTSLSVCGLRMYGNGKTSYTSLFLYISLLHAAHPATSASVSNTSSAYPYTWMYNINICITLVLLLPISIRKCIILAFEYQSNIRFIGRYWESLGTLLISHSRGVSTHRLVCLY